MGTSGYQWVLVGTSAVGTSVYQEYQEDQDQISGATYISNVIFRDIRMLHVFAISVKQLVSHKK